jgi:hypothetical protein
MNDLIERLKGWSDSYHKCTICGQLEPSCNCVDAHPVAEDGEHGENWTPTPESEIFDEAVTAIELLYNYAVKVCPKCDGCGKLLLGGGIVESDGLHGKPARIVCIKCADPNAIRAVPDKNKPQASQNWHTADGSDVDELISSIAPHLAAAKRYNISLTREQLQNLPSDDEHDIAAGSLALGE